MTALDVLHVICTRLCLSHLSVHIGDSSRRSEEIVKNRKLRLWVRLLLLLLLLLLLFLCPLNPDLRCGCACRAAVPRCVLSVGGDLGLTEVWLCVQSCCTQMCSQCGRWSGPDWGVVAHAELLYPDVFSVWEVIWLRCGCVCRAAVPRCVLSVGGDLGLTEVWLCVQSCCTQMCSQCGRWSDWGVVVCAELLYPDVFSVWEVIWAWLRCGCVCRAAVPRCVFSVGGDLTEVWLCVQSCCTQMCSQCGRWSDWGVVVCAELLYPDMFSVWEVIWAWLRCGCVCRAAVPRCVLSVGGDLGGQTHELQSLCAVHRPRPGAVLQGHHPGQQYGLHRHHQVLQWYGCYYPSLLAAT